MTSGADAMTADFDRDDPRALVRDGYDRASHAYRGDDCDLEQSGYGHWLRRLAPMLTPGARVIDLGCGNGVPVARELARRGFDVTGVDLSPVQVDRARALVPGARFVCADMGEATFEPGSFDVAVAFYSIINLPLADQPLLIARLSRWLVPGGALLAIVGKVAWSGEEPNWRGVEGVRMYYSHASVATYRAWLGAAGFTIETEGSEPREGNPGYSVLIARAPGGSD